MRPSRPRKNGERPSAPVAIAANQTSPVNRCAHRNVSTSTMTAMTTIATVAPCAPSAQNAGTSTAERPTPCIGYQCGLASVKMLVFTCGSRWPE